MTVTIFHNPRCSKSRQTLELLHQRGQTPTVIEYLKTPPDASVLRDLVDKLDATPIDIIRTGEPVYKEAREAVQSMDPDAQLKWLTANPQALQRPIVVAGGKARIGRPPESVLEILP